MKQSKFLMYAVCFSLLFSSVSFATIKDEIITVNINGTTYKIYNDSAYEEGSTLSFYRSTKKLQTGTLAEDALTTIGDLKVRFKASTVIHFYESGNIACGTLAEDFETNLIKYKANNSIEFFESGKVKSGTLVINTKINNILYKGLNKIVFFESGQVKEANLAKTTKINGVEFSPKHITYYESGNVFLGWLAKNTIINGVEFKGLESISFYQSKNVIGGTLLKDITIGKYKLQRDTHICFYDSGKLKWGKIYGEYIEAYGMKFLTDSRDVYFYESGKIQAGFLAEDVLINNIKYEKYHPIKIDENGNVIEYGSFKIN